MGISAGMGMALGARLTGHDSRTYVMLGDGECQEGEVWEAAMAAARYGLDNLIAIIDHNKLQQYGWPGDGPDGRIPPEAPGELVAKWTAFGWRVLEVDGHDIADILRVLGEAGRGDGRPVAVIAHTIKGKGVSFMEGHYFWHTRAIKPEEFAIGHGRSGRARPGHRRSAAMTLPMGRPDARGLRRDGRRAGQRRSADRHARRRRRQLDARPTSSRRPTRTATSRWASPSRTCSASRPGWRRWA